MNPRPRLLVVSPRFLFPLDQGGKIRTANILRHLRGGAFEIVLASPAPADHARFASETAALCDQFLTWPEPSVSAARRALSLFGPLPVAVASDRSSTGREVIRKALATRPDVLLVDFPHAAVLLPDSPLPASVIFTHNVEAEIFDRHATVATGAWHLLWREQARRMRRFEGATLRRFDSVIAVSARDAKALQRRYGLRTVEVIDTGVDLDFHAYHPPADLPPPTGGTIVFSGAMDWHANIDGIRFLMDEVWPAIVRARPDARALIVGRNPPASLVTEAQTRGLAWRFTGYVEDIRPHVRSGDVYVIPLRVGSGTRIKAFEAIAMGRPVVSTRIGVEGLDITDGEHFLAADTQSDFAAAILALLDDPERRARIARAARTRLEERFSWAHVARQFESICLSARDRPAIPPPAGAGHHPCPATGCGT